MIPAQYRPHVGWSVFLGLVALFIFLGLLKFLVFFLFMHLVGDLLVHGLGNRLPFLSQRISRRVVLYAAHALVAAGIVLLLVLVIPHFISDLPRYAENLERVINEKIVVFAQQLDLTLDTALIKRKAMEWGRAHLGESFNLAKRTGVNIVLLLFAFVLNFLILHDRLDAGGANADAKDAGDAKDGVNASAKDGAKDGANAGANAGAEDAGSSENLWNYLADFIAARLAAFYGHFRQVMAAQVIISLINACLTVVILYAFGIPHKVSLTVLVFVFGLLPVIGNLISNTLICLSALVWAGPWQLVGALVFLVVIHKLEYFLNSKIIGNIVRLPMYMTLLGLMIGESLFHISGMILAVPIILFVRGELAAMKFDD